MTNLNQIKEDTLLVKTEKIQEETDLYFRLNSAKKSLEEESGYWRLISGDYIEEDKYS
jgi:hypothetical protein